LRLWPEDVRSRILRLASERIIVHPSVLNLDLGNKDKYCCPVKSLSKLKEPL
jgi:hypothetical protein